MYKVLATTKDGKKLVLGASDKFQTARLAKMLLCDLLAERRLLYTEGENQSYLKDAHVEAPDGTRLRAVTDTSDFFKEKASFSKYRIYVQHDSNTLLVAMCDIIDGSAYIADTLMMMKDRLMFLPENAEDYVTYNSVYVTLGKERDEKVVLDSNSRQ